MITGLDRIVIAARDPDSASTAYAALLGQPAQGGRFQLANTGLQIVGAGEADEGLSALVFSVDDLTQSQAGLARRGLPSHNPDEAGLAWIQTGTGVAMALVQGAPPSPAPVTTDQVSALDHVVIRTRNADRTVALYGARLGLDFKLDRSNPQWGARLLFFRCGQSVIESSAPLTGDEAATPDRLDGLAWRVADPIKAQARLTGAGFDVSQVRKGRKPGTAVFTLRSGVVGAPSLLIGPATPDFETFETSQEA